MKYIYSRDMCSACIKQKREWIEQNIEFKERPAERLMPSFRDKDEIDIKAFVQLQMQNQELPVVVEG